MIPCTQQDVYDTVVRHLHAQRCRAMEPNQSCRYRGPRRTSYAVGCLFPDEVYESDMEGNNPGALWVKFPAVRPYLGEEDDQLPGFLRIHDNNWNWYDAGLTLGGITELRRVAEDFGLSTAVLEELWPTKQEIGTC